MAYANCVSERCKITLCKEVDEHFYRLIFVINSMVAILKLILIKILFLNILVGAFHRTVVIAL